MNYPALEVKYRRWNFWVGGPLSGQPIAPEVWAKPNDAKYPAQLDQQNLPYYSMEKITVGGTRLVLKIWMFSEVTKAEALEIIWQHLLDKAGAPR